MRDADELLESGLGVVQSGFIHGGLWMAPLFSGGHDSLCATFIASQHPRFTGDVHHIDTGIGANYTRRFVEGVCDRFGWKLHVHKSKDTYEKYVLAVGFPGPGRHQFVYNRLKDRCVRTITHGKAWRALITGCRKQESTRRMGFVAPVQIGEISKKTGRRRNKKRVWTAPCHDWSKAEQCLFMDEFGLPINKFKVAVGLSGECGCGAFAVPGEIEAWRQHAPEVTEKIDDLAAECKRRRLPCVWGMRPEGEIGIGSTGPLCSACDQRAAAAGLIVLDH